VQHIAITRKEKKTGEGSLLRSEKAVLHHGAAEISDWEKKVKNDFKAKIAMSSECFQKGKDAEEAVQKHRVAAVAAIFHEENIIFQYVGKYYVTEA
jgi:hypothetical protein